MSLSVERLKELAEAMSRPIRLDGGAMSVGATKADISDCEVAIRELIALKEAEPVAYIVEARDKFLSWDGPVEGGNRRTPLIRKPE